MEICEVFQDLLDPPRWICLWKDPVTFVNLSRFTCFGGNVCQNCNLDTGNMCVSGVSVNPSSKLVNLINPIGVTNGPEATRLKYGVVLGVQHGKNLQPA